MENKELFNILCDIDVSEYIETKKNGNVELTYLSWANCWKIFKKECPDADYEVKHFDGKPFLYDENLGYMVETSVTTNGETKSMWLPVMDGANKAQKSFAYTYKVKKYENKKWTGEYEEKTVEPASMFDINTAIMRCLVKNIGMFGLGLYIYAGEDIPEGETVRQGKKARKEKSTVEEVATGIQEKMTLANWKAFYARAIESYPKGTEEYNIWIKAFNDKKKELEQQQTQNELQSEAEALDNIGIDISDDITLDYYD